MMPTLTDPAELEEARQASLESSPPARKTPQGLLSLANARIPSNLPPRKVSYESLGAVDRRVGGAGDAARPLRTSRR